MKSKKVLSLLLACAVTVSMGTTVFASTEDQIAAAQEQKQEAQAGLAQAQANISDLESKKQELKSTNRLFPAPLGPAIAICSPSRKSRVIGFDKRTSGLRATPPAICMVCCCILLMVCGLNGAKIREKR